jgi:hypothetical protein
MLPWLIPAETQRPGAERQGLGPRHAAPPVHKKRCSTLWDVMIRGEDGSESGPAAVSPGRVRMRALREFASRVERRFRG